MLYILLHTGNFSRRRNYKARQVGIMFMETSAKAGFNIKARDHNYKFLKSELPILPNGQHKTSAVGFSHQYRSSILCRRKEMNPSMHFYLVVSNRIWVYVFVWLAFTKLKFVLLQPLFRKIAAAVPQMEVEVLSELRHR